MNKKITLLLSLITISVLISYCYADINKHEDSIIYEIHENDVCRKIINETRNGRYIAGIELTKEKKLEFMKLTKSNIGKKLIIIFLGEETIKPTIREQISSGVIILKSFSSEELAVKFFKEISANVELCD